jgi:probable rRNA maturation factor
LRLALQVRGRARVSAAEKRTLLKIFARAMQAAGAEGEVALSLTDDRELHALNQKFAGEDHATDVLSFNSDPPLLGDIVISVPYARRQAKGPLVDELIHLAVHGLAHLLGFDHRTKKQEREMFGYEEKLRDAARARGPVRRVRRPYQRVD